MLTNRIFAVFLVVLLTSCVTTQNNLVTDQDIMSTRYDVKNPIDIYVTPYFVSDPLDIRVGKFSQPLTQADSTTILQLEEQVKSEVQTTNFETLYVLSIRLYNLGYKDRAAYWFFTAQHYARVFRYSLNPDNIGGIGSSAFEKAQASVAFNHTEGNWINGFAFDDIPKLVKILTQVFADTNTIYDPRVVYTDVVFKDTAEINAMNRKSRDETMEFLTWVKENGESVTKQRKANGLEGKY